MSDPDAWARRPGETPRAYEAFRRYRDAGPTRNVAEMAEPSARRWAQAWSWAQRAAAWDDEVHRRNDAARLEQIRTMDDNHQRAARALITAGLRALAEAPPLTPHQAARFVDLGTRLERATLLGDHLDGPAAAAVPAEAELSPLERIARELAGTA